MFGFLRLNASCLSLSEKNVTSSHMCGICNFLSARYGFQFRGLTNHDAIFYSILTSAQSDEEAINPKCPFRLQKPNIGQHIGIKYASAISLLMAKTKVDDDLHDSNTISSRAKAKRINRIFPFAAKELANLDFKTDFVQQQIESQHVLEDQNCNTINELTKPSENVVSEIFTHTARLARKEENVEPLTILGKNIGRLMYLMDAYIDLPTDVEKGRFNALSKCYPNQLTAMRVAVRTATSQSILEISGSVKKLKLRKHARIVNQALVSSLNSQIQNLHLNQKVSSPGPKAVPFALRSLIPTGMGPLRCCSCEDPCGSGGC
jgi:hypothetical protein